MPSCAWIFGNNLETTLTRQQRHQLADVSGSVGAGVHHGDELLAIPSGKANTMGSQWEVYRRQFAS